MERATKNLLKARVALCRTKLKNCEKQLEAHKKKDKLLFNAAEVAKKEVLDSRQRIEKLKLEVADLEKNQSFDCCGQNCGEQNACE